MRILLWHGYLLSGSGSNVYTANLAEKWREAGHDVLLMCQERSTDRFPFIDDEADQVDGKFVWRRKRERADEQGRCRLIRPDIHKLLPVYVYDDYEGFEVKRFVELIDPELERYTRANVDAMVKAIEEHQPEAIITGHEVMGPAIARRACGATATNYLAKLHGSGLEFAVKKQGRYRRHAIEGLGAARVVVGGSRYMIEEASSVVPGFKERAVVVNPGCDTKLFRPKPAQDRKDFTVGFVGKLIEEKGVQNLLRAIPLMRDVSRVVIVGYGEDEKELRNLAATLTTGDRPIGSPIEFTGRLDHDRLPDVLRTFDVLVAPSVVPEAFGLVIAEAAACGVLPIAPDHSGIGEAASSLEKELAAPGMLTFEPSDPIQGIAAAVERIRALSAEERGRMGAQATEFARRNWSWTRVAERLLDLAAGGH